VTLNDVVRYLGQRYIPDKEIKGQGGELIQIKYDSSTSGTPQFEQPILTK